MYGQNSDNAGHVRPANMHNMESRKRSFIEHLSETEVTSLAAISGEKVNGQKFDTNPFSEDTYQLLRSADCKLSKVHCQAPPDGDETNMSAPFPYARSCRGIAGVDGRNNRHRMHFDGQI
jgi:hypothetical protein